MKSFIPAARHLSRSSSKALAGLSSTVLFDPQDPVSPINRRISIVVLNKRTEEAILAYGRVTEVAGSAELTPELLQGQHLP